MTTSTTATTPDCNFCKNNLTCIIGLVFILFIVFLLFLFTIFNYTNQGGIQSSLYYFNLFLLIVINLFITFSFLKETPSSQIPLLILLGLGMVFCVIEFLLSCSSEEQKKVLDEAENTLNSWSSFVDNRIATVEQSLEVSNARSTIAKINPVRREQIQITLFILCSLSTFIGFAWVIKLLIDSYNSSSCGSCSLLN
jgi:hypothetical protein